MDIKKFISNNKIDNDYNKIIQIEIDAIKHKTLEIDSRKCLYKVSECDFLKPKISVHEMFKDPNIIEFMEMCDKGIGNDNLAFSGPMIKCVMDPNPNQQTDKLPITNYYVVTLIGTKLRPKNILNEEHKNIVIAKSGYYIVKTSKSIFYLDKKTSANLSACILDNQDNLDRIALCGDDLWVSGMFILELYKRVSCYDVSITDPVFGYPEDILDIYDRSSDEKGTIKNMIDSVNIDEIQKVEQDKIENTFILVNEQKYTTLEYTLLRMMDENIHPVISYQMRTMILYLIKFQYFRPSFFVAKMIGFDKKYPGLYESILTLKHSLVIDPNIDTGRLESIYHIDMWILNHLIKTDSEDHFVDYISRMGIVKKFKQESKTIEKIVDWLIEFKSAKIISTLVDCMILSDYHRYKIIFLTQEFNLLGRDFLRRYVLKKPEHTELESDTNNENNIHKTSKHTSAHDPTKVVDSDIHENDSFDSSDEKNETKEYLGSHKQKTMNKDFDDKSLMNNDSTESTKGSDKSKQNNYQHDNRNIQNYYDLKVQDQHIILNILPCVIERSLTRAFYMVLKLCPYILETSDVENLYSETRNIQYQTKIRSRGDTKNVERIGGNILHTINNDKSVDILEIILKKNKNLIDEKDDQGRTPLILYAELGLGECIQKLIEYGADYEIQDNNSDTFLHKLCANGKLKIVQNVIRNVIDIIDVKNDKMMTPALIAAMNKQEEIFYVLKGLNANLDETDIYGNTVYHYICGSKICPGILIVNKKNKFGFTPYDYCKIDHKFYYFQK